jgi:hypothetical protein
MVKCSSKNQQQQQFKNGEYGLWTPKKVASIFHTFLKNVSRYWWDYNKLIVLMFVNQSLTARLIILRSIDTI